MDGSRKNVATFSDRNPLNGTEVPASKTIKPSQIHRDFQPFRTAAAFIVSPSPHCEVLRPWIRAPRQSSTSLAPSEPQKLKEFRMSPAHSIRSEQGNVFRPQKYSEQEIPAQLIASCSFGNVPVQVHSFKPIRSDAIRIAREKMNNTIGLKATKVRSIVVPEPRRLLDFEPYSLNDFKKLKPSLSQAMGGLGPYMIGSPQWDAATEKAKRAKNFSESIRRSNTFA